MSGQLRRSVNAFRARAVVAVALVAGVVAIPAIANAGQGGPSKPKVSAAQSSGPAQPGVGTPADDQFRGLRWAGLRKATSASRCRGGYELASTTLRCTHGPDPVPTGVNALRYRSTSELQQATAAATAADQAGAGATTSAVGNGVVGCYDDGQSGDRIQVIYAHAADVTDRYASLTSMFPQWAANTDASFNDSAAQTGGVRHLRFLTDASCNLVVDDVQLTATGDDTIGNTMNEIRSLGYTRADRKYLILVDTNVYCGIATVYPDDQQGQTNANNSGPSYARVDYPCWGLADPAEAHEVMHMLGAVQASAPHATQQFHCYDEHDRMCYQDAANVTLTYPCASQDDRLFDCNHDDYYNTNPAPGSYLATHWNTANNAFLATTDPIGFGTTTSTSSVTTSSTAPSDTSTTAPAAQAAAMRTDTLTGSVTRRYPVTYSLPTGAGTVTATLSCTRGSMQLALTDLLDAPMGSSRGRVPVTLTADVPGGTYNLTIQKSACAAYTLTVSYPAPSS